MRTWIKLYTEILDDPKIGRLPSLTRLMFYDLLAIAGKRDEDGLAGTIGEIAWQLRSGEEEVEAHLLNLENAGMVVRQGASWVVSHFADRQARYASDEPEAVRNRVERHRKKKKSPVFERDNWTCRYCGTKLQLEDCVIDHVQPISRGGSEDIANLATSCAHCNWKKGARTPEQANMPLLPIGTPHYDNPNSPSNQRVTPASNETPSASNATEEKRREVEEEVEQREAEIAPPPPPPKESPRKKENAVRAQPALAAYRAAVHRWPPAAVAERILAAVGPAPPQVALWKECVETWLARGYNPGNVEGMLEWFAAGKIPTRGPPRARARDQPSSEQLAANDREWLEKMRHTP